MEVPGKQLDKNCMSASMSDQSNDEESYEPCEKHPKEFIKYFCSKHNSLICGHCLALEHRSCNVNLISELCKSEYGSINKHIVDLLTDVDGYESEIEKNMDLITQLSKAEVFKLREYRDHIEKYFQQRIDLLLENIQQMKSMDETLLDSLKPKCDHVKSKVETLKSRLSSQESNPAQLFIETKRAQTELVELRSTLAGMKKEKIIHEYRFEKDSITEKLIASTTGLGTIKETHVAPMGKQLVANCCCITKEIVLLVTISIIGILVGVAFIDKGGQTVNNVDLTSLRFTQYAEIPVYFQSDTTYSGMKNILLLPGNRLLQADWNNKRVKMIDLQTYNLMSQVSVPGHPLGMCFLSEDRVAVSLSGAGSIQFLATRGQLSLEESIKVDGDCCEIGYFNDRLIVSYYTGNVEIMDMTGKVIKKIDRDENNQSMFVNPLHLTVVSEGLEAVIYVSDLNTNTITKLDMDLNILQTFQDPALKGPRGITAVGNQLLICGKESNNIMCLDLPSGKMTQLLGEGMGINSPISVRYNEQQNNMYVTGYWDDSVKVYKGRLNQELNK